MGLKTQELEPTKENIIFTLKKDLLDRNVSVLQFARFCDAQEGRCSIAIDAGWGFGKTFFVKQTKLLIELYNEFTGTLTDDERDEIKRAFFVSVRKDMNAVSLAPQVCVYYDAWSNDNDVDPILSLVYEILRSTASDYRFKKGVDCVKAGALIADFFSGKNIADFVELAAETDPLSILKSQKEIHSLVENFLDSLLAEQGNRLVVFIDELDRCKPSYAVHLLERIKHYFSNDRITFVFSVNIDELQHTIKRYYGEGFDACRYLDRFFDYRLSLPPADMAHFYYELGLNNNGYVYESVCKAVIAKYSFGLRETEKFYRMAKIAAYLPTHNSYYLGSSAGNGLLFGLFVVVPIAIGLRMVDTQLYYDFVSGNCSQPLIDVLGNGEIARGCCSSLLENTESFFEDSTGKKTCVKLSDKLEEAYTALFIDDSKGNTGETVIGQCYFDRDTRDNILKAISLLSEYSSYD